MPITAFKSVPLPHPLRAAEVGVDKSLLLRGQPTAITESVNHQQLTLTLQTVLAEIDVTPDK